MIYFRSRRVYIGSLIHITNDAFNAKKEDRYTILFYNQLHEIMYYDFI